MASFSRAKTRAVIASSEVTRDIEKFLAAGGRINKIPVGVSAEFPPCNDLKFGRDTKVNQWNAREIER